MAPAKVPCHDVNRWTWGLGLGLSERQRLGYGFSLHQCTQAAAVVDGGAAPTPLPSLRRTQNIVSRAEHRLIHVIVNLVFEVARCLHKLKYM